jgi:lipoprotein-anchoring transpeptidase ErfK/SrfK
VTGDGTLRETVGGPVTGNEPKGKALSAAVAVFLALACATGPSVPIAEITPDPGPLAVGAGAGESWRAAADQDRIGRSVSTPPLRQAPIVGTVVEPLARSVGPARNSMFEDISASLVNASPTPEALRADVGPTVLRTQILLDRAHFSVGAIDGRAGKNTALAIYWFQASQNLPTTGILDVATYQRLASIAGTEHVVASYTVTPEDVEGARVSIPRSVYDQEKLRCLCYSSHLEALVERFHTKEEVLRRLNPNESFTSISPGLRIWAPSIDTPEDRELKPIARIHISKKGSYVHALALDGSIVFHFPSTLGSAYDPSPEGRYYVTSVAYNPTFRYDPTLFSDIADDTPKAKLPPGPNSPVGLVWIALSKEHVGIHGTPTPETIGTESSHGCVRLTNWDALRLANWVEEGVPVEFVA